MKGSPTFNCDCKRTADVSSFQTYVLDSEVIYVSISWGHVCKNGCAVVFTHIPNDCNWIYITGSAAVENQIFWIRIKIEVRFYPCTHNGVVFIEPIWWYWIKWTWNLQTSVAQCLHLVWHRCMKGCWTGSLTTCNTSIFYTKWPTTCIRAVPPHLPLTAWPHLYLTSITFWTWIQTWLQRSMTCRLADSPIRCKTNDRFSVL